MPKTLKVYAGSELESRYGEQHFVLRHLRKAVCWVASSQFNIHAFQEARVLDELAENAAQFLYDLGRQAAIVMSLTGRRQANFVDVINALYMKDRRLYRELLEADSNTEFCAAEVGDDSALLEYVAARLGRSETSLLKLPPTFLELTMERLAVKQPVGGIVPAVSMTELLGSPVLQARPGSVRCLGETLSGNASAVENQALNKWRAHVGRKEEKNLGPFRVGVLKRPALVAAEQPALFTESAIPLIWPSDLPDWAPLLPADAPPSTRKPPSPLVMPAETVALQLELCDIEADYPPIEPFQPSS